MRSKAPLVMMEQMIMLLVFALAAVLCLQAFTTSREISDESICRDRAVIEAQNVAESLKIGAGEEYFREKGAELTEDGGEILYDAHWQSLDGGGETSQAAAYRLQMRYSPAESSYLQSAEIVIYDTAGEPLFSMPVSWQAQEVK